MKEHLPERPMNPGPPAFHVDGDELRELGFREAVVGEALADSELGIVWVTPSDELVQQTIVMCRREFPRRKDARSSLPELLRQTFHGLVSVGGLFMTDATIARAPVVRVPVVLASTAMALVAMVGAWIFFVRPPMPGAADPGGLLAESVQLEVQLVEGEKPRDEFLKIFLSDRSKSNDPAHPLKIGEGLVWQRGTTNQETYSARIPLRVPLSSNKLDAMVECGQGPDASGWKAKITITPIANNRLLEAHGLKGYCGPGLGKTDLETF